MSAANAFPRAAVAVMLASVAPLAVPQVAFAEVPGVKALIAQGLYWKAKGRQDLAEQALRRALALDPGNAEARRALAGGAPAPAAAPAKVAAAPKAAPAKPAPRPAPRPAVARAAPQPAPRPAPVAQAAPAPRQRAADAAGKQRMAGFDALDDNNLDAAASRFQKALGVNRNDGDALGGLGIVRLRQSRFAEARDLLEQASRQPNPGRWAEALAAARFYAGMDEARTLLARGQTDQAQATAEALVRSGFAQTGPALELLADIYERQGRFADAADFYRQAAETAGAQTDQRLQSRAARGRALAAVARGDDLTAEQEFQGGLMLDQTDPWIRYEFARFLIRHGRSIEAESLIGTLTQASDPDALYAAALIDADLGRNAAAEALIDRVPETQRTPAMRNFALGIKTDSAIERAKAMAANGQRDQAIAALRQLGAIKTLPAARRAAIASALFDLGDGVGAGQFAQQAMSGDIGDLDGYDAVVRVLAKTGRDDLARAALQKAATLGNTSPEGQRTLARMSAGLAVGQADRLRLNGQYAQAFDVLRGAWGSAPDSLEILSALARLYQSGGMSARAAQTFQIVLTRDGRNRDALLGLAQTAQAAGDKDLSQSAATRALQAFPQDYQVRLTLAQVAQARGDRSTAVRLLKEARALYARQTGSNGIDAFGGNPFAADPMGVASGNPFRDQPAAQPQPQINPFALGGGTRLPTAQVVPMTGGFGGAPAYAAPASFGAPAYGAAPGLGTATAYAAPGYAGGAGQGGNARSVMDGGNSGGGYAASGGYAAPSAYTGQSALPAPAFGAPAFGTAPAPAASPFGDAAAPLAGGGPVDPVMAKISGDIAQLTRESGPRIDLGTSYRERKGETGLSQLSDLRGSAEISTGLAGGRVRARAEAVVIDSGRPTGSGLARFGTNATIEAQAIVDQKASALVQAETQHQSGLALSAGYDSSVVHADVGTTPIGMGKTQVSFHAGVTPSLGNGTQAQAWVERRPVTDSVISYAGTRDPVSGETWGQVMRLGGGAGLSVDRNGSGAYGTVAYNRYRGTNVRKNHGVEANVGGYLRVYRTEHSALTSGINVNYQSYDNPQNYFTYGHGGYFSPQSFLSVSFPVRYSLDKDQLSLRAAVTPGYQSYSQKDAALYPTDDTRQGQLNVLKSQDSDVRARYDSLSKTGFALSAEGSLYYQISPSTRIGGEASYNTFGSYDELRSTIGIRQSLGATK
ncbi:cellulose synthase subunit BcsC-related outer membrane protein [Novosphingobium rhizosphaerae]|uniref:cellulose biosynthesis protein BcsC n=1 Tax=Novosphingobium rhizosphaerae TaxID=1551649 RepID=UPI0017DB9702